MVYAVKEMHELTAILLVLHTFIYYNSLTMKLSLGEQHICLLTFN